MIMKQQNLLKIFALIVAFLMSTCLSFFLTRWIRNDNRNENVIIEPEENLIDKHEDFPGTDTIPDTIPEKKAELINEQTKLPEKVILKASRPVASEDNNYSFKASFSGEVKESYHFELWNNTSLVQTSKNGSFANIPEGNYKLSLISDVTGKNIVPAIPVKAYAPPAPEPKKLISESDFQIKMLDRSDRSLNGGKKSFVTKGFSVVVVNTDASDNDFVVSDIQDVRDMIYTYGKWKSARVVELEYDSKGYVTLAKIAPVFNNE